jgi:hypothetical protein
MSVIKPDSVIGCVGDNDVIKITEQHKATIDTVYDGNFGCNSCVWFWNPKIEYNDKTWLIYKYNSPTTIQSITISIWSSDNVTLKIYKNVNENFTTSLKYFGTSYRTLTNIPNSPTFEKSINNPYTYTQFTINTQDQLYDVNNLYFEFDKKIFIHEIECKGIRGPISQLKSEKGELKLKNFIPKNYCMFTPNIDGGEKPRSVDSIVLINNNIYFCVFEVDNSVKINVFTKDGNSLDHIFIPNLPDKSKLIQTILNGKGLQSLPDKPYTVYKYSYNYSDFKTKTQWYTLLSSYIITSVNIKNLYENGDENIVLNKNTITYVNINTQFYVNYPSLETDRILVYQQGTNKLLHITDWIAKGTTQNVTINYTNNNGVLNVTSSVIPVNRLPVPNLISDGNSGGYVNGYGENRIIIYDDFAHITDTRGCPPGSIVYNIQTKDCAWPVVGMYYNCKNPYNSSEPPFSPYGGWVGRSDGCNYNTITSDEGYSGMYAEAGKWLDKIIFKMPNGTSKTIGRDGGKYSLNDYNCPNGKIVGFKTRTDRLDDGGDDGIYAGIQAYCASPKIP